MQGWRIEMEDAHTDITGLNQELQEWSFFGIFDGHAGSNASLYCAEKLLGCVLSSDDFKAALKSGPSSPDLEQLKNGIKMGFFELDKTMRELPAWLNGDDKSGTTAVTTMVTPKQFIFANCGDSRAILCSNGKVTFHTVDHKPSNPDEKTRIEKAGGSVMIQRVNGSLAVSRALGDFEYKMDNNLGPDKQLVSPEPEISVISRQEDVDEFIVIGCDGIWDVMTNEEVGEYIRSRMLLSDDLELICSELLDTCLAKVSCCFSFGYCFITYLPMVQTSYFEHDQSSCTKFVNGINRYITLTKGLLTKENYKYIICFKEFSASILIASRYG